MKEYAVESVYFGENVGWLSIFQLEYGNFNDVCAVKYYNRDGISEVDNTGLRLYSGTHVGIRFVLSLPHFVKDKSICELGCGIGAFGLLVNMRGKISKIVLTDAEESTLKLCKENIALVSQQYKCELESRNSSILCETLRRSEEEHILHEFLRDTNNGAPFDVIIGCELMYYRTNVASLVSTVCRLVDRRKGIFIHAHLFRRHGQAQEMIDQFLANDWLTYEAPHASFIDKKELSDHPEWYRVRQLISGQKDTLESLKSPDWVLFSPDCDSVNSGEEEDENCISSLFNVINDK